MPRDCRAAAARALGQVLAGRSLNQVLPDALQAVSPRDRGLLQQLCYGTLRQAPRLQALLGLLLDKPLRDRDRDVQGLLMCGLYQLDAMRTPDHAAVSATVQATGGLGKKWARGVVNAVLRRYLRERDSLIEQLDEAAAACHPQWLYRALLAQWPDQARSIIDANNRQPPMTLRVNARATNRDHYLGDLVHSGLSAQPGALSPQAIYLEQPVDVEQLPGFQQGAVSVQDEAAQLAALLLEAAPGDRVLDACAAPGGKTCHILEGQPHLAELVAMDSDAQRLALVRENLDRLGLDAELLTGDAGEASGLLGERRFDRILVDAPCSATGVIRRHPDIKLLRQESDIGGFADQQQRILEGVWPLLATGGRLLYATCSVLTEENGAVVEQFASRHTDAAFLPLSTDRGLAIGHGRQLLPTDRGPDGLFYALLEKRS
jgi:16S rRNA (cytosine967-C5)-methyltransferase